MTYWQYLIEFVVFFAKTFVIVGSIGLLLVFILQSTSARGRGPGPVLEIEKLNSRLRRIRRILQTELLSKKELKKQIKDDKKTQKKEKDLRRPRVFVLDFEGDVRATAAQSLRDEVTAVIEVAEADDEVVLRLESGGGLVTSYGFAASQLTRLRTAKIRLTVSVDKIAASGGYMMACVGDRILAAPFAVIGSIGVIAQVPNFSKLLKRADIDYREVTAGEFKRTVTMFGEITPPGMEKFKEQIQDTHDLFKKFIAQQRPHVDLPRVATGEHWYGTQAIDLGLIDEILTSDEYLLEKMKSADVFQLNLRQKKTLRERLQGSVANGSEGIITGIVRKFFQALGDELRSDSSTSH